MRAAALLAAVVGAAASPSFQITNSTWGAGPTALTVMTLGNSQTGELIEVIPELGGRTEALKLRDRSGVLHDVLLTHSRNVSAIRGNVGWRGAMLMPFANRIANGTYSFNGRKYYLERNEDRGVYGKCALHGYLYKHSMTVLDAAADDDSARLLLGYRFDGTDPGYPFNLYVKVHYVLDRTGITFDVTAENHEASDPLPFLNAWHPYFQVNQISRAAIQLDPCTRWNNVLVQNNNPVNSSLIPTGFTSPFKLFNGVNPIGGTADAPTYYDIEFKATADRSRCNKIRTRITDLDAGRTAVLWQESPYRWVQVYTGTLVSQGKNAVAMEPMSSQADAWNSEQGINVLQAGEDWRGAFGIYLE
eukprot:TRINITY_DN32408_c0_g1_i1.p1 TRINITY_DN32408_c0_g1~~TRINITY_DN32408_c0_g1_i1.p1  ORF type:complete len:360 (+),score=93.66 TRINITY_DN32408_c0_g1_i1:77-1156(+)